MTDLLSVVDLPEDGLPTRPINGSRGMLGRGHYCLEASLGFVKVGIWALIGYRRLLTKRLVNVGGAKLLQMRDVKSGLSFNYRIAHMNYE